MPGVFDDAVRAGAGGGGVVTDAVSRTRRYGVVLRKTVYGLVLLFAFLLFIVADTGRVLLKRLAD